MFIGDYSKDAAWNEDSLNGCAKFLDRVYNLGETIIDEDIISKENEKMIHKGIKKVSEDIEALKNVAKQNRQDIKQLNKVLADNFQKIGIVKYDAFHEMGGNLSFALTMLDGNNNGWIINAMHSREGCYTYIKEIVNGESYIELAEEEAESLDRAIYQEAYGLEVEEPVKKESKGKRENKKGKEN